MNTENWLEISVWLDGEAAEAISEIFNRYGTGGAVIEQRFLDGAGAHDVVNELAVKTYIPADDAATKLKIEEALWHLGQLLPIPEPKFQVLGPADWAEAWKAAYSVMHIGKRTVIVPQWQEYSAQPGQIMVRLDPGMAFGTGTHPTTRLCLIALEAVVRPGMCVLDIGAGSGVLSIAAAKQGASPILAVDIDDIAIHSAKRNIQMNGMADVICLQTGSIENAEGHYDLVLVNILARVILSLLDQGLADLIQPGGIVIASGIIDDQEDDVRAAFEDKGIEIVDRLIEKDWVALIGRRRER